MIIYLYRKYKARKQQQEPAKKTEKKVPGCPHRAGAASAPPLQKCTVCAAEKSRARKYRWKLLLLLLPGFFLASLDLTIIATALPFIASHFGSSRLQSHSDQKLTKSRQIQRAELDCHGIHFDIHCFHPSLRPTLRYIRKTLGHSISNLHFDYRKHSLCCSACLACAPPRTRTAGRWHSWYTERWLYHLGRLGLSERAGSEHKHLPAYERHWLQ
jgi:hypothetical protein